MTYVLKGMALVQMKSQDYLRRMNYKVMSRLKRLHPETMIEVLVSWVKLKWDKEEDLILLSAEALLHRSLLSSSFLAKVNRTRFSSLRMHKGIWAWSHFGEAFSDHVEQFFVELTETEKLRELSFEDALMILSVAKGDEHKDKFQMVVAFVFSEVDAHKLKTTELVQLFTALGKLQHERDVEWRLLLKILSQFRRLNEFEGKDFVPVMETYLSANLQNESFIDILTFEAAQEERLPKYTLEDLTHLTEQTARLELRNIVQIFAEEILNRDDAPEEPAIILNAWLKMELSEDVFIRFLNAIDDPTKQKLEDLFKSRLKEKGYHQTAELMSERIVENATTE